MDAFDPSSKLSLLCLGEEPSFTFWAFRERPGAPVEIGGKEDHFRSPGDKSAFDWHLHCVPLEYTEQVAEWHTTIEVVEERSRLIVVTIVPRSSGTDGLDPQADMMELAVYVDGPCFAGTWETPDDNDMPLLPVACKVAGGLHECSNASHA